MGTVARWPCGTPFPRRSHRGSHPHPRRCPFGAEQDTSDAPYATHKKLSIYIFTPFFSQLSAPQHTASTRVPKGHHPRMALGEDVTVAAWGCPTALETRLTEPGDVNGFHIFPYSLEHGLVPVQALRKQRNKPPSALPREGGRRFPPALLATQGSLAGCLLCHTDVRGSSQAPGDRSWKHPAPCRSGAGDAAAPRSPRSRPPRGGDAGARRWQGVTGLGAASVWKRAAPSSCENASVALPGVV